MPRALLEFHPCPVWLPTQFELVANLARVTVAATGPQNGISRLCQSIPELPRRLVFSETQKARGGKKTAGALEETPALFIRLLRKGVPKGRRCRPSFIYALWAPGPAGAPEKKSNRLVQPPQSSRARGRGSQCRLALADCREHWRRACRYAATRRSSTKRWRGT
jgi:hypothetical protein